MRCSEEDDAEKECFATDILVQIEVVKRIAGGAIIKEWKSYLNFIANLTRKERRECEKKIEMNWMKTFTTTTYHHHSLHQQQLFCLQKILQDFLYYTSTTYVRVLCSSSYAKGLNSIGECRSSRKVKSWKSRFLSLSSVYPHYKKLKKMVIRMIFLRWLGYEDERKVMVPWF